MAALQIQALVVGALAVHSPALTGMRSQVGRQSPSGSSSGEPRRRVSQEAAAVLPPSQALPDCSLDSFTFSVYSGNATGTVTSSPGVCSTAHLSSSNELPAAAAFSSELFRVDPVAIYEVSWAVQTSADFAAAKGCKLAATAFVQYFDAHDLKFGPTRDSDGWAPALADQTQAPVCEKPSTSQRRSLNFTAPSSSQAAILWLVLADGNVTRSMASGSVQFQDVHIRKVGVNPMPEARFWVPDTTVQAAINMSTHCLRNSALQGRFTVGSDYQDSHNVSPDQGFGTFGVRRFGTEEQVALLQRFWTCESDHFNCQADGSMRSRTMSVLFFALGVDQFFSYTGNTSFLREMLPQIDLTMKWVNNHSDSSGLFECGTIGTVSCPGPMGMDWVDWHQSRAVGKTFIFESWYAWTLRRIAALHEEFASSSFGSARLSAVYHARADSIVSALRRGYWMEDHWRTNEAQHIIPAESNGIWTDDQVWSLYFNVTADSERAAKLWAYLESTPADGLPVEGVPCRWSNISDSGRLSWSWFGRLGAGDILARFRWGKAASAHKLLKKTAEVFVSGGNIYESYDMTGRRAGDTGGDYLEHCSGYAWAVVEGAFGINFESDVNASATITPRMDPGWPTARGVFRLRGVEISLVYTQGSEAGVVLAAINTYAAKTRAPVYVRVIWQGRERIEQL